jgi:hypothetical protein
MTALFSETVIPADAMVEGNTTWPQNGLAPPSFEKNGAPIEARNALHH